MSTYQDRAKLVLVSLVTNFAEKDEQGEWWGHDTNLGNQEEAFDQALSELASIVEEVIGKDEKITMVRGNRKNGLEPYRYIKASDMPKYYRNKLRQEQRDQLSNRRGDGHTN